MIFMTFMKSSFQTLSRRFVGFNIASVFCLAILFNAKVFPVLATLKIARHCGWHQDFQLSTSILHNILDFFICWINEVNTTQCSSIVELQFVHSPLSLFSSLRRFRHIFPHLWRQSVWAGGRLFSCQSPTGPWKSIWWFLIQFCESCETCPRIWQFSISINVRIVVDKFLQHYIEWYTCSPGHVDEFQWNRKWFFSRHVQFGSSTWWRWM